MPRAPFSDCTNIGNLIRFEDRFSAQTSVTMTNWGTSWVLPAPLTGGRQQQIDDSDVNMPNRIADPTRDVESQEYQTPYKMRPMISHADSSSKVFKTRRVKENRSLKRL